MPVRLLQVTALAAFFCASGAHASSSGSPGGSAAYDAFMGKVYGNSTTVSYGTNGTPLATSSANLGTPHTYGGVGIDTAGPAVKGNVTVPLGDTGKAVQVTAKSAIPRANVARGLVKLAKLGRVTPGGLLAGVAIDALLDYGLKNVKLGDDGNLQSEVDDPSAKYEVSDGFLWSTARDNLEGASLFPSPLTACTDYAQKNMWGYVRTEDAGAGEPGVHWCRIVTTNGLWESTVGLGAYRHGQSSCTPGMFVVAGECTDKKPYKVMTEQELLDAIASQSGWPASSAKALQHMLGEPSIRTDLDPQPAGIVGPMTVPGATSKSSESVKLVPGTNIEAPPGATQTDPGTKTTTSTKTHPITYSGSDVKFGTVTNNVTNITNNVTNVTTTESTKTEEKQDDNKPDLCEKHPDTIGCQKIEFDTPEGEIPRKQIDVSWSPVDLGLGGGSCPAPVQLGPDKQFSYQATCDNLHIIKPLVIAVALFIGGMIIFGGRADQ